MAVIENNSNAHGLVVVSTSSKRELLPLALLTSWSNSQPTSVTRGNTFSNWRKA